MMVEQTIQLLRGIDVTDAHHGGMTARSPLGHVMFCDGVFHRSQLETPHGVIRGVDATTYRFDLRKGTIEREYQTLTPNHGKSQDVGAIFSKCTATDLFKILTLSHGLLSSLPIFKRAISVVWKGLCCLRDLCPNFPEEYQQGMATAVLLRKCFFHFKT